MRFFPSFFIVVFGLISIVSAAQDRPRDASDPSPRKGRPLIQVAILLDTSGSMEGLIHQARAHLWTVVTELGRLRRNGQKPVLEVALFEYGNSRLPESSGYIRKIVELTTDLDRVSEELFKLTTDGGYEYCGEVIRKAVQSCEWSTDDAALKFVFIAGNEPFNQGSVEYEDSCRLAVRKGITVNTIFCGSRDEGIQTGWLDGARLAGGEYASIDHNIVEIRIRCPQDDEILRLNIELNGTYLGFGETGRMKKERQVEQDRKAEAAAPQAAVSRAYAKASGMYVNSEWDVVDAAAANSSKLDRASDEELPPEMRGMNPAQRKAYAENLGKKRKEIQQKIERLGREREVYLKTERSKSSNAPSLDEAVVSAVRSQAGKKGFSIE
jgi:hypothetical protein